MNGIKKPDLVKALCRLSAQLCAYIAKPCDCKYMLDSDTNIASGSENGSGCPEITMAALIFEHMTEQEFNRIAERAGVNITVFDESIDVMALIKLYQKDKIKKNIKQKGNK